MIHRIGALTVLGVAVLLNSGCNLDITTSDKDDNVAPVPRYAIIAGQSDDFSTSDISIADAASPYKVTTGFNETDRSDYTVAGYEGFYYRIGRYDIDTVSKYDPSTPSLPLWEFSTNDPGDKQSRNPQALVFASSQKAYLLRLGSSKVWIINPSATAGDASSFKRGEIDLSAYNGNDLSADPACAVIADGKLFIAMQRLDESNNFAPDTAYIAVIDIDSNTEIDTNPQDAPGALKGIPLSIKNPQAIDVAGDRVLVAGVGNYFPVEYSGGIESINPSTYARTLLIDDGNATLHPYGQISGMVVASPTLAYFKGYADFKDETLYAFNPATGVVNDVPVADLKGLYLSSLNVGHAGETLWVGIGDASRPRVEIITTQTGQRSSTVELKRNPVNTVFIED